MIKLVVNNTKTPRFIILDTLKAMEGKECSLFHALRDVPDFVEGVKTMEALVKSGEVTQREQQLDRVARTYFKAITLTYYRLPVVQFDEYFRATPENKAVLLEALKERKVYNIPFKSITFDSLGDFPYR